MNSSQPSELGPLNILHLAASIGRDSGGLGPTIIELVREQRALDQRATIWSLDTSAEAEWVASANGITANSIVTFPDWGPAQFGFSPKMEREASSPDGATFDILHQHSIWMGNSRATNRWRAKFKRPTVVAICGTLEKYALNRSAWKKKLAGWAYERENLTSASCLHATALSELASIRQFGLANPVAVIPLGVPAAWLASEGNAQRFRHKFAIPMDARILLFLSRIDPKKGLAILLNALAQIRPQIKHEVLVIGGTDRGGYLQEFQALARDLNVDGLVKFVGPLHQTDKRDAFAAASVFVLPTYSENFGIVIAEALGAGVPVLTTTGTPWEEIVTRQCGWWVDPTAEAMRQSLLEAVQTSQNELAQMGARGKLLIEESYNWQIVARRLMLLYCWLLGRGPRPPFVVTN